MRCRLWIPLVLAGAALGGGLWWFFQAPGEALPDTVTGPVWFADVTEQVGLHFVHDAGPVGTYFMPQIFGSGVAVFDCDGDGRLDIYVLTLGGPDSAATNRLFKNMPDGTFRDITEGSGLGIPGWNTGVAVGDVDNDGLPDVLVTQYGGVKLFLNQGGGKFLDVTEAAGLKNPAWGASAAFFDYDRDGWLDLVIINYVDYDPSWTCRDAGEKLPDYCTPQNFPGAVSRLFRNVGAPSHPHPLSPGGARGAPGAPRFQDISVESGIGRIRAPGLGVLCADFNGDGWPDVFVANDGRPSHLWINQKDGTFTEEANQRGVALNRLGHAQAGMGIAYGDVDGDGLMDLFVTHLRSETHSLWRQEPRGLFIDRTTATGLDRPRWQGTGFGTVFGDFDLDGHLDLVIVNGHVVRSRRTPAAAAGSFWEPYTDRNQVFTSDGTGRFTDISQQNEAFCGRWNVARGLACGDLDGDGKLDLVVSAIADKARVYRNVAPTAHHWFTVRTRLPSPRDPSDRAQDRDALGAEVVVEAGSRRWIRLIHAANSYLSSSAPSAHFGLGDAAVVTSITVRWPDGTRERFAGTPADRIVDVRRGEGQVVPGDN